MLNHAHRADRFIRLLVTAGLLLSATGFNFWPGATTQPAASQSTATVGSSQDGSDSAPAAEESVAANTASSATSALRLYLPVPSPVMARDALHRSPSRSTLLQATPEPTPPLPTPTPEPSVTPPPPSATPILPTPTPGPIVPPPTGTVTVTLGPLGGVVASLDARVTLIFPVDALTRTTAIAVTSLRPDYNAEGELRFVTFDLNAYAVNTDGGLGQPITRFAKPYTLTLDLAGYFDLAGADRRIRLKYLDEAANEWVDLPVVSVDRQKHLLVARLDHFSSFGAGLTNEYWKLLFNDAKVGLFSGEAVYDLPIEVPPGRGGLTPQVNLSYNSKRIDGILNWSQNDWAGLGWSVDQVEIVRRIQVNANWAGCTPWASLRGHKNDFSLTINGTAYKLVPASSTQLAGQYYAEADPALYVVRHNAQDGQASPLNYQGEWWEVKTPDGTRYEIGRSADAEQRVSYIATYDTGQSLGCNFDAPELYAGPNRLGSVAYRWRVNQISDVWSNQINLTYAEWSRTGCANPQVDHASYLSTISYNGGASLITFVRGARGTGGNGGPAYDSSKGGYGDTWSNPGCENFYQPDYLASIQVQHTGTLIREYKLDYTFYGPSGAGWWADWQQRLLASVTPYGKGGVAGGSALPATTFGTTGGDLLNHEKWLAYEPDSYRFMRLTSVSNGYTGVISFAYATPNSGTTDYYNYHVTRQTANPGVGVALITDYTYYDGCYRQNADPDHYQYQNCVLNRASGGALIGFSSVSETLKADDGVSNAAVVRHWFHNNTATGTDWQRAGREYKTEQRSGDNVTLLASSETLHVSTPLVGSAYFVHTDAVTQTTHAPTTSRSSVVTYTYDTATGNRTTQFDKGDPLVSSDDCNTRWEYAVNNSPGVWILNTVKQESVYEGLTTAVLKARTRYHYDNLAYGAAPTKGALTRVEHWDGSAWIPAARTTYDTWGHPTVITDALGYTTTTTYESAYRLYPLSVTNAKGHVTQYQYYGINGVPDGGYIPGLLKKVVDPNNAETRYTYDAFGRLTKVIRPYDSTTYPSVSYAYADGPAPFKIETWQRETSGCSGCVRPVFEFYDGLGRLIQTRAETVDASQQSVTNLVYDARGLVKDSYLPAFESYTASFSRPSGWDTRPKTTTQYDALGRTTVITAPDGTLTRHIYTLDTSTAYGFIPTNLWVQAVVDAKNHVKHYLQDAFGRLVRVREFSGTCNPPCGDAYWQYAATYYAYDALGNLARVTDTLTNTTVITYNLLGQKTGMTDPDMGAWDYAYDANGNLTVQDDAKHQRSCFYYDALNRLQGKYYTTDTTACPASPVYAVSYTYDSGTNGKGRRTAMSDPSGSAGWSYDLRGRMTTEAKTVSGASTFNSAYGYDAMDRVTQITYPSGEVVQQTYNAASQLTQVRSTTYNLNYASGLTYNALGQIKRVQHSNGLETVYNYFGLDTPQWGNTLYGRVRQICVIGQGVTCPDMAASSARFNVSYWYDNVGNVTEIGNPVTGESLTYTYDALDRLTGVSGTYAENYDYNPLGNIVNKGGTTYAYDDPLHKHAVTALNGVQRYWYDANGNMAIRNENGSVYNQAWDVENRLTTVAGPGLDATYGYDGDSQRVKKIQGGQTTLYIGPYFEQNISTGVATSYYFAGSSRVAMRVGSTLYYLVGDHLGSTSMTLDSSGNQVGELRYKPFGETRYTWGSTPTDRRFTGQREESTLGSLYDYGARFYSPVIGRFLSADTIVPEVGNSQNFNRYSYVTNNPLKYTDPSGHCFVFAGLDTLFCTILWFAIGSAATYYAVMPPPPLPTIYTPPVVDQAPEDVTWTQQQIQKINPNPSPKPQIIGDPVVPPIPSERRDDKPDIVYRVMRPDEHPGALVQGIWAKDPSRRVQPQRHVTHGNVEEDNWISATRDPDWARRHQEDKFIYKIDLNKVNSTIVDTTKPGATLGWHWRPRVYARRASEVLIDTHIPPGAISGIIPPPPQRRR